MVVKLQHTNEYKSAVSDPFNYPGVRPKFSFLLDNDIIRRFFFEKNEPVERCVVWVREGWEYINDFLSDKSVTPIHHRYPVIGYGSLTNPSQLFHRFNLDPSKNEYIHRAHIENTHGLDVIPAVYGTLENYDTVYMAHASKRGYIPVTLIHSPDTSLDIHVLFLDDNQIKIMDISEGRDRDFYNLTRLEGKIRLENGQVLDNVFTYTNTSRVLQIANMPVRPVSIPATNTRFSSRTQEQILNYLLQFEDIRKISTATTPQMLSEAFKDEEKILSKINKFLLDNLAIKTESRGNYVHYPLLPEL